MKNIFFICVFTKNLHTNQICFKKGFSLSFVLKLEADQDGAVRHPYQEKEPLEPHPGGINPTTGEIGGPRGPEPTRYGDWERKGRVTDF